MRVHPRLGLAALATAGLLAGCQSVGPNYRIPDEAVAGRPAANAPFIGVEPRAASADPVPGAWWRLYQDPVLDELIGQALAANTDLRVAQANIARAEAGVRLAKDAGAPKTGIGGGVERGQLSGEQYLLPVTLPVQTLYDLQFQATYQLDLFGQIKRGIEAARADDESVRAAYDVTRITVVAETARAYADACDAGEALAAAHRVLDLQKQSAALTARLVSGGRGNAADLTRVQGQVALSDAGIPALEAQRRIALYRLATLTGRPPAEFPKAVLGCAAPPRLAAPIPVGDGAALIKRRPDIRRAERSLAAATARIGVATADLYPKVALGLNLGSTGVTRDFLKSDTDSYGLGPLITWTFPNRSAAEARISAAKAGAAADYAQFDGTVLTALREVESALTVYARDLDRESDLETARARAATALDEAQRLQAAGRQGSLAVLEAERSLALSDQSVVAIDGKLSQDQIALFLALGGGWGSPGVDSY
jgi:NodT family efflux transporter outer membrane factor (OMF) lipoprotein